MNPRPEAESEGLKDATGGGVGPDAKLESLARAYRDATAELAAQIDGEDWGEAMRVLERRDQFISALAMARDGAAPRILPVLREIFETEQRCEGRLEDMKRVTMAEIDSLHQMERWARIIPATSGRDARFVDTQG